MKVVILAGGFGTRFLEETKTKPKALVEIGSKPIIWHVMKHYALHGFKDFIIACGYKGDMIKEQLGGHCEPDWNVEYADTGLETQTGGRIKRVSSLVGNEAFMLTWCDGVSDIDLNKLLEFHKSHGKTATVTAVRPPERFGLFELDGDQVVGFSEKPEVTDRWINGVFCVLEPSVFDYIDGDSTQWEKEPMEKLTKDGQLMAFRHTGFWQCMDTLHEKNLLEDLWEKGAPWKKW